jgi:hypothetical protein
MVITQNGKDLVKILCSNIDYIIQLIFSDICRELESLLA